ncbi:hypothetical protein psal_cds_1197 [Pandoravirus salinus]|uniref:Uncharacterized protein n=1 Tax=Pandoravirus salinus TaxID=1349410 RepID=S4W589_9VIRU|nr:hypothetical protein psal_cds_1197 [Pandoravirus salinus]AGO85490.1 hypothetical protein psal_cds_1197 [Pandoravirus salinus]
MRTNRKSTIHRRRSAARRCPSSLDGDSDGHKTETVENKKKKDKRRRLRTPTKGHHSAPTHIHTWSCRRRLGLSCAPPLIFFLRVMAQRAATTVAKALAPRCEMTSVGASIIGSTRDGRLAQVSLTAVYEYRGRAAVGLAYEDQLAQAFFEAAPTTAVHKQAPVGHTWWPRRTRLCAAMAPVCALVGLETLSRFDLADLALPMEGALVAYRAHGHATGAMARYGAVPMAVLAETSEDHPTGEVPWMYLAGATCLSHLEAKDAGAERGRFHKTTLARDAALKAALIDDHDPYSPQGVDVMAKVLRRIQKVYVCHGQDEMGERVDDLVRQLFLSPHLNRV